MEFVVRHGLQSKPRLTYLFPCGPREIGICLYGYPDPSAKLWDWKSLLSKLKIFVTGGPAERF